MVMELDTRKIQILQARQSMTTQKLAMKSGVSRQQITLILSRGTCRPVTAGKLAKGLGVDVEAIVKDLP